MIIDVETMAEEQMVDGVVRDSRPDAQPRELPTGTVTLLFTDIEGSTRILQRLGDRYPELLAEYRSLLRAAFQPAGGREVDTQGDAFFIVFPRAVDAVRAAVTMQRAVATHSWPEGAAPATRMALHTGEPELTTGGYVGLDVNRAARICALGHGGQALLSETTAALVADDLAGRPPRAEIGDGAYEEFAGVSLRDLGRHHLRDIAQPEHIFQLVIANLPSDFQALRALDRVTNLPAPRTSLIGREREVNEVCALLRRDDVRLVTLTGPGGTGKTRLGIQVGINLLDDFPDGVFVVELAPINDPSLVASTVAQTLGIQASGRQAPVESLKAYLQTKRLLLVLDNFEQVIAAAPLLSDVLQTAPLLKLLVTSRAVLRLSGEYEYAVLPLALPDPQRLPHLDSDLVRVVSQYAAVALFVQRAQAVKPDFKLTPENARAVAEICRRLDGLPLAIELAAARIKLFAPQALLQRLDKRFKLLTGGGRDLPRRQQTIGNTIDWSFNLLTPGEQSLFTRLGVFVGGCDVAAAEAVCRPAAETVFGSVAELSLDVLDGLASLADKSLLRQQSTDIELASGEPRFFMLETIREYAVEHLAAQGQLEVLQRRHAEYYLHLAEMAEPKLTGADQEPWLERLETEHDNLRAALIWSQALSGGAGEPALGLRLIAALWRFWLLRGYFEEWDHWLRGALAIYPNPGAPPNDSAAPQTLHSLWAKILMGRALLAWNEQDLVRAAALSEESLALYRDRGDKQGIAASLIIGGIASSAPEGRRQIEEGLALAREIGDRRSVAFALLKLAGRMAFAGDHAGAQPYFEEGLALARAIGDRWLIGWALFDAGREARTLGDHGHATALLEESLHMRRSLGDKLGITWSLMDLSLVAMAQGDYAKARRLNEERLKLEQELANKLGIASSLTTLAEIAELQGDRAEAATRLREALAVYREANHPAGITWTQERLEHVAPGAS